MAAAVAEKLRDLPSKVHATYERCLEAQTVLYYPSEVTREQNDLRTEVRLCESLSKKPGPSPSQLGKKNDEVDSKLLKQEEAKKKKDVLAAENWDSLLIDEFDGGLGEQYGLLLNKFAVVPLHFLLVTKHYEPQHAPLTPPQLLASYQILQAFANADRPKRDSPGGDLLVFYNCGEDSGASQQHKHLQMAPMEGGEGSLGYFPTEKAAAAHQLSESDAKKPFSLPQLPYAHHIRRIDIPERGDVDPMDAMQHLAQVYLSLLDAMIDNLRALPDLKSSPEKTRLGQGMSYNLLMTRRHMHIIPRSQATFRLPDQVTDRGDLTVSTDPTIIGCNSLAYTGTVLVKSSADAKRLVEVGGVLKALEACGYPKATPEESIKDVAIE